jgi:hypothetical protein
MWHSFTKKLTRNRVAPGMKKPRIVPTARTLATKATLAKIAPTTTVAAVAIARVAGSLRLVSLVAC